MALRLRRFDRRRVLLFLIGWAGHRDVDFLTHVDDTRPLFWPLLSWKWSSPVSYYNPLYYGLEFKVAEHAGMLAVVAVLFVRRLRCGRRGRKKRGLAKDPVEVRCRHVNRFGDVAGDEGQVARVDALADGHVAEDDDLSLQVEV